MKTLLPLALFSLLLVGCSKSDPAADASTPAASASNAPSGSATIKHAPDDSAPQGAAYRITPANPNDPHFKPDPKLAGGG